jgi:leucyl-tRNA synthetase family protein
MSDLRDLRYDPKTIEPRWQDVWAREHTWEVSNVPDGRPKYYVLEMLPYPSGEPHMGHLKNYALGDAVAHFNRRIGRRVLHPMGYDAFGLPAENNAIKTGVHPREATAASIASFQRQFREWGISIDWTREFGTHEPRYYRWTQWLFLQLFERGLAYRNEAAVNWDPVEETVLANEQVVDGRGERSGALVEVRQLEQWFFRITDYADRLLEDLDTIEWPEHVKTMQRNWIGRSEGAEVVFRCEQVGTDYPVFTTRPDTLFGATFFVMAPEHPDVFRLAEGTGQEQAVHEYVNHALSESNEERGTTEKPKTGVALGRHAINLFATRTHTPRLARRVSALGGYFTVHAAIAPRDRELVVLRTAALVESDYEIAHHRVIGAAAGLTAEEIDAAADPGLRHPWAPADRALLDLADELIREHRISDATWSALADREEAERIELVVLAGTYALLGGVLNGLGVELDASPPAT